MRARFTAQIHTQTPAPTVHTTPEQQRGVVLDDEQDFRQQQVAGDSAIRPSWHSFLQLSRRDVASSVTFVVFVVSAWLLHDFVLGSIVSDPTMRANTLVMGRLEVLFMVMSVCVSAAIAIIVYLQSDVHGQARGLAEEMMSDLIMSREQFRLLYDNSPMPYFLIDERGVVHNPNKATLRFFGTTIEELDGTVLYDRIVRDEKMSRALPVLLSKVERGVPISRVEAQIEPLHGEPRWVLMSIFTVDRKAPLDHNRLVSLVDVTEEKEIDRVKTDFVSLASHQLRTPLTAVKWYIDMMLTSKSITLSEQAKEYLDKIYTGNERMISLVGTLLNVSRIEMGTVPVELGSVDLEEVTSDVVDEVAKSAEAKNIRIHTQHENLQVLRSDRNLIRIAIQNLITNAIRYTPEAGGVVVATSCGPVSCTITVSDTGCGIPPEAYGKLFSKMYRAENAKKIETKGTGLGLYMTKAFVEKIGGTIEFVSSLGKGTTFTITLPIDATTRI